MEKLAGASRAATGAATGAAVELAKNRDLALKASTSLGEALTALAAREEEHGKLAAAEKKDAAQLKKSAEALAAAQKKAAGLAAEVSESLERRAVAKSELDKATADLGTTKTHLTQLTVQVKTASEAAATQKTAMDKAAAGLQAARALADKWKAAIEIDKALDLLALKRKEHTTRLIAVEENKLALEGAAARLGTLRAEIKANAEAAKKAAEAAAETARNLLEKAVGSSSKAAEIISKTETLELDSPETGKLITDLKQSSEGLASALAVSVKAWEESRRQAETAAGRGAELAALLGKELSALASLSEKLLQTRASAANAETAVKAAEADWKKWTDSFETAGKNVPRDSAVAVND
jgi:hypothetical protein